MSFEHVHALAKGSRLNQYEMVNVLGAGAFGITYMARDTSLDTMVAIKEYLPDDLATRQGDSTVTAKSSTSKRDFDWGLDRFLAEARVLAKFRHPNIVRVNQIFEANNTAYLVMDYAKGESLDDLLRRTGPLSEQQTKDILFPILDGLKRVHQQGFLHRDIKPNNIIIREEGGAVLIDFGAARQATETRSRALTSIVTEGYAPLEQYDTDGNQGPWTDLYAVGGVAYKCLTGNKPPPATSRVRADSLVPLSVAAPGRVSTEFASAIELALRVHENERPRNVDEFLALISGATVLRQPSSNTGATRVMPRDVSQTLQPPAAVPAAPPPPAPANRNAAYLGAAAAAAILAAAGAWFYFESATTPPDQEAAVVEPGNLGTAPAPIPSGGATTEASNPAQTLPGGANGETISPAPAAPSPVAPNRAPQSSGSPQARPAPAPRPSVTIRASFDCTGALNPAQRLVCSDNQLAALDVKMAGLYRQAINIAVSADAVRIEQQVWLSQRDECADKECLVASYNGRIEELERWVGP